MGLRLKVWLRVLGDASREPSLLDRVQPLLPSLVAHGRYLEMFTSFGPDTHNHLLTELCARLQFRYVFEGSSAPIPIQRLERRLLREIQKQFWRDGSPGEGSVNYHFFVLESLYELYLHALCERPAFAVQLHEAMSPLVRFGLAMLDDEGRWPTIGDTDGGIGTGLFCFQGAQERRSLKQALTRTWQASAVHDSVELFRGLGVARLRPSKKDLRVYLMLGPKAQRPGVHRSHHQADRLSMVLQKGNRTLLADPGTYTYNGSMPERVRDRITSSHNAPGVAGVPQMDVSTYRFGVGPLPSRSNECFNRCGDSGVSSIGASIHVGKTEIRREWYWSLKDNLLFIADHWRGEEGITPEVWWHLGPEVVIRERTNRETGFHIPEDPAQDVLMQWWSPQVEFHLSPHRASNTSKGQIPPRVATHYGIKAPTEAICLTPSDTITNVSLFTWISLHGESLDVSLSEAGASWTHQGENGASWTCTPEGQLTRNDLRVKVKGTTRP